MLAALVGCRPESRPFRLQGTDLGGGAVTWAPQAGRLGIVVAAPAKGCPGCLASILQAVGLLLDRRPSDVDAAVIVVDGTSKALTGLVPKRATVVYMSLMALEQATPAPGMPLLLVVSRGGRVARIDWLPPMQVDPAAFAEELERYFTLEE